MQSSYAFSATVFFTAFIAVIAVYGGEEARSLIALSAFFGATSQFVAQDPRDKARIASVILAYAAMALGLVAWFFM